MILGILVGLLALGFVVVALIVAAVAFRRRGPGSRPNEPYGSDGSWHSASANDTHPSPAGADSHGSHHHPPGDAGADGHSAGDGGNSGGGDSGGGGGGGDGGGGGGD